MGAMGVRVLSPPPGSAPCVVAGEGGRGGYHKAPVRCEPLNARCQITRRSPGLYEMHGRGEAGNPKESRWRLRHIMETWRGHPLAAWHPQGTRDPMISIGARHRDIGARHLDIGARHLDIGARHLDIGARHLDIGARHLDIGARHLERGVATSNNRGLGPWR
eukprot:scaffold1531_cov111-Isochrysis_galbana.AAC.1